MNWNIKRVLQDALFGWSVLFLTILSASVGYFVLVVLQVPEMIALIASALLMFVFLLFAFTGPIWVDFLLSNIQENITPELLPKNLENKYIREFGLTLTLVLFLGLGFVFVQNIIHWLGSLLGVHSISPSIQLAYWVLNLASLNQLLIRIVSPLAERYWTLKEEKGFMEVAVNNAKLLLLYCTVGVFASIVFYFLFYILIGILNKEFPIFDMANAIDFAKYITVAMLIFWSRSVGIMFGAYVTVHKLVDDLSKIRTRISTLLNGIDNIPNQIQQFKVRFSLLGELSRVQGILLILIVGLLPFLLVGLFFQSKDPSDNA